MKYLVKTRNWNESEMIYFLLRFFNKSCDNYTYNTNSIIMAFLVLFIFLILRPISGGWTYIKKEGVPLDGRYGIFYLK